MSDRLTEQSTVPEPDKQKPLRILAVEDEIGVAALMEAVYSKAHQIEVVTSADQALEKLRQNRYDMLITDKGLEGPKDGFELVDEMNAEGLGDGIFLVMVSGSAEQITKIYPGDQLEGKGIHKLLGKDKTLKDDLRNLVIEEKVWREKQGKQL